MELSQGVPGYMCPSSLCFLAMRPCSTAHRSSGPPFPVPGIPEAAGVSCSGRQEAARHLSDIEIHLRQGLYAFVSPGLVECVRVCISISFPAVCG